MGQFVGLPHYPERRTEDIMRPHYHVVTFINGCLNDGDSGPYLTLKDARAELRELVQSYRDTNRPVKRAGIDRYQSGIVTLKIEACTEALVSCENDGPFYY